MTGRPRLRERLGRLPETRAALEYAERQHAGQRRSSDDAPFIEHPLEVGWLLYGAGAADHVIAAGLLHDVLEKTEVGGSELTARFGSRIAALVRAVSEDQTIPSYRRRKAALRQQVAAAGPEALTIFAADKLSKVRELRAALATATRRPAAESLIPPRRMAHLRHCLELLQQRLGDSSLVWLLGTELAQLTEDLKSSATMTAVA